MWPQTASGASWSNAPPLPFHAVLAQRETETALAYYTLSCQGSRRGRDNIWLASASSN
jgi:hypothetical protein